MARLRHVPLAFAALAAAVILPSAQVHGSSVRPSVTPSPVTMCSVTTAPNVCVEEITVNGAVPTLDSPGSPTRAIVVTVPGYTPPEGSTYKSQFTVTVMELPTLFNVMVETLPRRTSGLDPSLKIGLKLNLRGADISYGMLKGPLDSYETYRNDAGDLIVSLVGSSARQSWFSQPEGMKNEDWETACSADGAKATVDYEPYMYLMLAKMPRLDDPENDLSQFVTIRGLIVSTNYGCGEIPIPWTDNKTGQLSVTLRAPHFTASGEVNTGFFKAILPPSWLIDGMGISIEEALAKGVSLSTRYGSGPAIVVPAAITPTANGGVMIEATEAFHYSAPKFTVKRSKSVRTGTRSVAVSSTAKKVLRGAPANATVLLPGVNSGKGYAYVVDKKGLYTFLGTATISKGKARITGIVPQSVVPGKGKLVFSYKGSKVFARAALKKTITIG